MPRGHSFSMYAQRRRGSSKIICHAYHGERELTHLSMHAKSPTYHTLLSMAMTFIAVLKSTFYDYFPVSQIFYNLFLYGLIDWIFESFPNRNGGVRWERVHMEWGVILLYMCVYTMGKGGSNFCYFGV